MGTITFLKRRSTKYKHLKRIYLNIKLEFDRKETENKLKVFMRNKKAASNRSGLL